MGVAGRGGGWPWAWQGGAWPQARPASCAASMTQARAQPRPQLPGLENQTPGLKVPSDSKHASHAPAPDYQGANWTTATGQLLLRSLTSCPRVEKVTQRPRQLHPPLHTKRCWANPVWGLSHMPNCNRGPGREKPHGEAAGGHDIKVAGSSASRRERKAFSHLSQETPIMPERSLPRSLRG